MKKAFTFLYVVIVIGIAGDAYAQCSGVPTAGTVNATVTTSCSFPFSSTLSVTGNTTGLGIYYQWQSSLDNTTWTNIAGATNNTYTATVPIPIMFYRFADSCSNSGLIAYTLGVRVGNGHSYASLPFTESFEVNPWGNYCNSDDGPDVNSQTSPYTGNTSWRQDGFGSTAIWTSPSTGLYSPAASSGTYSAQFHNSQTTGSGNMDLYVNLGTAGAKQINFDYIGLSGGNKLAVYLSTDGGATFTPLDSVTSAVSGWSTKSIVTTGTSTHCVLRFIATGTGPGTQDIGLDNVQVSMQPTCSGMPSAGTLVANGIISCSLPFNTYLTVLGYTTGAGIFYQWQSSFDGITWSNVSGATNGSYIAPGSIPIMYYRFADSCSNSGLIAYTSAARVGSHSYASLPFTESFEVNPWGSYCGSDDGPDANSQTSPYTGNTSWRQNGFGFTAGWTSPSTGLYSPAASSGTYSAQFHNSQTTGSGNMDLYVNMGTAGAKQINFDYIGLSGGNKLAVYLSTDGGATFTPLDSVTSAVSGWSTKSIVTTGTSTHCVLRFIATGTGPGTQDIGLDNVQVSMQPTCSGMPSAGTLVANGIISCSLPFNTYLTVLGYTTGAGIFYQWQSSFDGITWSNVSGATNGSYIAPGSIPIMYYRFADSCSNSGLIAYTSAARVGSHSYASLPFTESFEVTPWGSYCGSDDGPDANSQTSPYTGNTSWRQNGFGFTAGWTSPSTGLYSPAASSGTYSAQFHNSQTTGSGNMDLYVNLGTAGAKQINFDYIGLHGVNKLAVYLSIDGGATFAPLDSVTSAVSGWTTKSIVTTATSTHCVLRFIATGSGPGTEDIGLDNVQVSMQSACSGMPSVGTLVANGTTSCSLPFNTGLSVLGYTTGAGIFYQWQSSMDGATWTNIPGATTPLYTATVPIPIMFYRFTDSCSSSGLISYTSSVQMGIAGHSYEPTLPFTESFETAWLTICGNAAAPNMYWQGSPYIGNNSWRQNGNGSTASWTSIGSGAYSPVSTTGSHSAEFHNFAAGSGVQGTLDLYINLSSPGIKPISFDYIGPRTGDDKLALYLSTDGGSTFTLIDNTSASASTWSTRHDTVYTTSSTCVLRFMATGGTLTGPDIGLDNVNIGLIPPCSGAPAAGTINASATTGCTTYSSALTLTGTTSAPGIAYQWQNSPDGTTFTPVAGATNNSYSATVSSPTYYNCIITCTSSGLSATTPSVFLNYGLPPVASITGATAVCQAWNISLTDVTTGGTWSSTASAIATVSTTGTVTGVSGGTAVISYAVTNVCGTVAATKTITVTALPNAGTITGVTAVCPTLTTQLTDLAAGGVWSSGATGIATVNNTGLVTGVAAGTAQISYVVTNTCGTASTSVTVTVSTSPNAGSISGLGNVCVSSTIPLSDNIVGGTWSSGSTSIATVSSTGVVGGVSSGTVLISYSVTNSCGTAVTPTSILVNPLPSAGTISGASSVCATNTITLSDNIAGGTWGSSNTSAATIENSGIVHAIAAGSTVVSYSVTNVCGTAVANKAITVNPLPVGGNISGTASVCAGANTQLSDNVGGGTWSSGSTGIATVSSTGLVHGVAAGAATISYSVTNSCGTDVSTAAVIVNPLPVAGSITGAVTVCVNATTALTDAASGGVWSSSNTGIATVSTTGVVKGLTAGTPVISYSVTNGCGTDVATKNITVNPLPDAGAITGIPTVCEASNVTLSDNIPGGTWSSGNTGVATISGTGIVHGVAPGSSVILYTYTNSCGTASVNTTVTVNPLPVPGSIGGTGTICVNASTSLTDAATGGAWSSTATSVATVNSSSLVTGVSAGTTTISYTVTNSCGTEAATAIVTVNALPFAGSITGANSVCDGVSVSVSDAATGGTWSSSNTTVATINSFAIVRGRTAGITTISYSVTNGCGTDGAFKTFTVNPQPVPGTISGNNTVCTNASTLLSDDASGGVWSSGNTGIATVDNSGLVTGISGGTAAISYSVTNGCGTLSAIYSVTVNPLPVVANITGINTLCPATTTSLSDVTTGGIWSSSATAIATVNTSGIVTGVIPGGAIISYAVTNGCGTTVVTRAVTVNSMPVAGSITGTTSVCELATTPLGETVSAGAWSSSNTGIAPVDGVGIVTGVAAGNVNITYSVTNSCGVAETSTTVTVLPLPIHGSITGTGAICAGSSITFSDAVTGGNWSSSNTSIAPVDHSGNLTGIVAGTVTISYTITNSCGAVSDTATVAINPIPDAGTISGAATVCAGAATQLSDASNGGTWSSSVTAIASISTTGVVSGIAAGGAVISYKVSNSCGNAVTTTTVTVNPLPVAGTITGIDSVCEAASISLSDDISGGVWSAGNAAIATVNLSGVVTGIAAGATTISYEATNSCGVATATITVRVNPLPSAGTITGISSVCIGNITFLSDVVSGGVWSSDNASIASVNNGSVSGLLAGTANISYGITNSCGSSAAVTTVTVNPSPDAGAISGSSKVCIGSAVTLSNAVSGGVWSVINISVATINTSGKLIGLLAGTDSVKYTVISGSGCVASVSEVITVHALPDAGIISGTASVCKEGIITLAETITGGTWSSSNNTLATINSNTGIVSAISLGTVTITYITRPDANGCVNDTTYTLTILSAPVFTITGNIADAKCYGASGGNITLVVGGGSGVYTYMWTNSDTIAAISDLRAGSYTVQVKDVTTQCILSDTFNVVQPDSISVSSTITTDRCQASNGVIALEVTGGTTPYSYQWSVNNVQGNVAQGLAAGSYSVIITDMQGCTRDMQLQVDKDTCNDIKVYEGISPNGDGVNDVWVISGIENYPANTVQLFDRWGDMVYEKSGYNNDWYGQKSNGSLLPAGTYYYLVKLNGKNMAGGEDVMTGSIMLKR